MDCTMNSWLAYSSVNFMCTCRIDLWTMIMTNTTLVVIFSAPMPMSPGGLVVRASD